MCDLLAVTGERSFRAPHLLPAFALQAQRNVHGWGLGWFDGESRAQVVKSARAAVDDDELDPSLEKLAEEVHSRTLLAHVRLTSSGTTCEANCHPFSMSFLGRDWLFVHNGTCHEIESYRTKGDRLKGPTNDSARLFEYLRDRIVAGSSEGSPTNGLLSVVADATGALLTEYPGGKFNYYLATDSVLFAFAHWRPSWLLRREKETMQTTILTTVDEGLTDGETWVEIGDRDPSWGRLVLFCGSLTLGRRDICAGM